MFWSNKNKQPTRQAQPALRAQLAISLEPRMLFDGAVAATAADAASSDPQPTGTAQAQTAADSAHQASESAMPLAATTDQRQEIVFIDGKLQNAETLIAGLPSGSEIVVLDSSKDGLQQIADYLKDRSDVDAIHLLSHGAEGTVSLGNTWLNNGNVASHERLLAEIGASLAEDGDILLYGCDTGAGEEGQQFIQTLAELTLADVATSDDATGSAVLGGNWVLEKHTGAIESTSLSPTSFNSLLASGTLVFTSDPNSPTAQDGVASNDIADITLTITNNLNASWTLETPYTQSAIAADYLTNTAASLITISSGGTAFYLESIFLADYGGNGQITLTGYRNSVTTGNVTLNVAGSWENTFNGSNGLDSAIFGNVDEVRITTPAGDMWVALNNIRIAEAVVPNTSPNIDNLDGDSVAWAGVGNTVVLDASSNAALSDTELGALNGGNGNWAGASLIVQRPGAAVSADTFGFNTSGALFTVSGSNLQSGGQTFATFTNTGGVLAISFTSSATAATTALVNDIAQRITYRSDTPAGDATLRLTLSDGMASTAADVTVTSNTIHVTATGDAQSDGSANGVTLREAITIANAQAGADTIILPASLAGQTVTLASALAISEAVTIDTDAAPGVIIAGTGITANAALTITNGSGDSTSISAPISGTGSVVKDGAGTLTLSGTNSYSGTTTISAGTLSVASDSNLGTGEVSLAASTTLTVTSATTINNAITLSGAATVNNSANVTLSGNITGAFGLTKTGAGFLTLSGTSQGFTTLAVDSGRLSIAADANLGSGALTLADGTRLNITGATTIDNAIILTGVATVFNDPGPAAVTLSGVISGSGGLTKGGRATLTLSASNTYAGATLVSSGTLVVGHNNALGDTAGATTVNGVGTTGGTLVLSDGVIIAENFMIAGTGGPGNNGTLRVISGSAMITGTVTLTAESFIRLGTGANLTVSGVVSGAFNLRTLGTGTTTLSGDNTYSGGTTIQSGTLSVASGSNLGTGAVRLLDGSTLMITGATTIANAIVLNSTGINTTHTVNNANAVTLSGNITGTLPLTKAGGGVLTLSGTNSYSGTTTVSSGTLVVTGSLTGAGAVSVASGATLSGTGSVAGAVTVASGGTAAPGVGPGLLTLNNGLTLASGSTLVAEVNGTTVGTGYDRIAVTGAVNVTGSSLALNVGFAPTINDSFIMVDNDGVDAVVGTFTGMAEGAVIVLDGNSYQISYVGGDGNDIVLTALSTINSVPVLTGAGGSTAATEQLAVAIAPALAVADADNATLASATVSLTGGYQVGQDLLAFANDGVTMGDITSSYNVTTGVLTLTSAGSTATLAQFQAALRAVTYSNSSDTPNTANRTVSLVVNDGAADSLAATQTLTVTAVNDAPVNAILTAQSVDQDASLIFSSGNGNQISIGDVDAGANSVEVTLSVTNGVLTLAGTTGLSFTTGDGSADSSMVFRGSIIHINSALATLTYSPTSGYNGAAVLSITTSDLGSSGSGDVQTDTDNVNITVNSLSPRITDVSAATANGIYKVGDTITLTTTFSEAVTVDTAGGTPGLLLETGSTDRIATYVSGSGSNALTFNYTVQAGDLSADLDYQSTAALVLNGATIRSVTSNDAVLTLPTMAAAGSLGANNAIVIDGVAATVSSVSVPANSTYVAGQNLDLIVNLSENVTVDTSGGTPRIAITLDTGGTAYASYLSGSGTSALVFRLTVASGQMDSNGISLSSSIDANGGTLRDAAGNNSINTLNAVGSTTGVLVDAVAPQVSAITLDGASPTNASSVTFTVTFSEDVSGVDIGDFSLATRGSVNASLQSVVQIDPRTYQVTVNAITGLGSLGLNATGAGIIDNANNLITNAFTGQAYAIDSLRPSASIVVAETVLAAGETSTVTITFNEAVTGLTAADFTVANGVLSGLSSNDGGIIWTATLTPSASVEDTSNVITLDNTGYTDLAVNAGAGSTDSNNYAVDTLRPSASIVVADMALAAGETSTVTITFNEAVTGLTAADFNVANGVLSGLSSNDGGITWTAALTPSVSLVDASNVITLDNTGYTDAVGNTGSGTTDSNNYAIDTVQALVIENGDPEFRANPPAQPTALPPEPLQPTLPLPSLSTTQSPLIPQPLFEVPTIGSGIPALGNIFINQNALAPSFIAQVFASSSKDIGGDGSGSGFLGFGGGDGDGGGFGSSSLSNIFGQDSGQEMEQLEVFDGKKWGSPEGSRPGTFGAPTLSQQLHELHEGEQRKVRELAQALGQFEKLQTPA